jgi:hypothetical protein
MIDVPETFLDLTGFLKPVRSVIFIALIPSAAWYDVG